MLTFRIGLQHYQLSPSTCDISRISYTESKTPVVNPVSIDITKSNNW